MKEGMIQIPMVIGALYNHKLKFERLGTWCSIHNIMLFFYLKHYFKVIFQDLLDVVFHNKS